MTLKRRLAQVAAKIERAVERVLVRPRVAQVIAPYLGYATPTHLVVRGRVLAAQRTDQARTGQSRWRNVQQVLRMFLTDEVADVTVQASGVTARSDAEGYFTLMVPRNAQTGWVAVRVTAGEVTGFCPVFVAGGDADFAVISDIDDTMMLTGAWSLWRNLWTTFTGNVLTRQVFGDAVSLMQVLNDDGRNPVYFVSSSPWNLHDFLREVFDRAGLPRAPMFLRDYGISETQFITGTHGDHKEAAIAAVMAAHPDLRFVLVGDTGQHDPAVYAAAAQRYPGRVAHVILRSAGGIGPEDLAQVATLEAAGVTVHIGADYHNAIAAFGPRPEVGA